ncbi:hypothetical protein FRB98_006790 [Tulasnella sp. 332]|nr:hypothetical protein FRB98_006790 [Tulasnella sp. 332]
MEKMQNRRVPLPQPIRVSAVEALTATPRSGSPAPTAATKPGETAGTGKKKGKKGKK